MTTQINNRVKRYITKALEASLESDYQRVNIGAVIVDGNYVVASACNTQRSHTFQARLNDRAGRVAPNHFLHAEVHALIRSGRYDLTGCELYVARYDRNGELGNCRPCPACTLAIRDSGVRRVYYTTQKGIESYEVV